MAADLSMVVDIVDENNRPIGTARRREVLQKGVGFRTVHVFLFDRSGKLLLQELPPDHPRNPGKLGSSVAGYLYSGESYASAAQRRMRHELDIDTPIEHVATWQMIDEGARKFVALFSGVTSQNPKFDPAEIAEVVSMMPEAIDAELQRHPERFTPTFVFAYERFRWNDRGR